MTPDVLTAPRTRSGSRPVPDTETASLHSIWFWLVRACLAVALIAGPLAFGADPPWAAGSLAALAILAMFFWCLGCAQSRTLVLARTPLYIPAVLFLLLITVQLLAGRTADRIATRDSILLYIVYLIVFVLAAALFTGATAAQWSRLGKIVSAYTLALSFFAVAQFFTSPDKIYWMVAPRWGGTVFGPYVNHNHYAGLMEMLVAITTTFWLARKRRDLWNWIAGVGTLIALASVALSGSRAGVASVLVEVVFLGVIAFFLQRRQPSEIPVPGLALGLLAATLLAAWMLPPETTARFHPLNSQDASYTDRLAMTADSPKIFQSHLLTGAGLGAFETVYPRYQSFVNDKRVEHAHNDYAEILAETGIAGALLVLAALALFVRQMRRNIHAVFALEGETAARLRLGASIGCLGLLVHSFFDFNLHIPANAAWFAVLLAMMMAPREAKALFPRYGQ
ncbi:MAG TPA: O-antigen ligase family protein [Candidatus Angelobacter sp.]|nr:O-antigen ligase family protein [Candidatus Angelobacter sp.]